MATFYARLAARTQERVLEREKALTALLTMALSACPVSEIQCPNGAWCYAGKECGCFDCIPRTAKGFWIA